MLKKEATYKLKEDLEKELAELRHQLEEANETIEAIRTGQIDALVVQGENGHQLYTLKTADQSYRVLIEKMSEGAVTLNAAGVILYSNSRYASMVNTPLSQVIGLPFDEFIAPENISAFRELFKECWDHDCKGEIMLLAGEKRVPVQLSLTKLELKEGVSLSIIITDLSSQKTAQLQLKLNVEQLAAINEALESSNHDLQQFASVASHDLQEPLRKIQVFSHLLKEKQAELTPESRHYLEKIIDSSARMKTLIIDILNYSRLSATDIPSENVDLNELLKDLKEDFELTIHEKAAELHVKGTLPVIEVNKGQIRQVFQNIISNALKFSQPQLAPVITVESKRIKEKSFNSPELADGPFCLITISDNGIGFDEKYMDHIFALFERLHSKDKYEGTGIGLAIAKKIIDKHNGLITANSREGRGASFMIILPMSPSNQ
jgi:PAS domain S-box-containing protein